ncbi:ABC transporter ATP-binding protein [Candidatus Pyrohabitans sp.]
MYKVILKLENVTKSYGRQEAVKNISFEVRRGEIFAILGPSGCGKTTTLRLIAGFDRQDEGEIVIDGKVVAGIPPEDRNVGMVFQEYALFPHLTVGENVAFGLRNTSNKEEIVHKMLELVGLKSFEERYPHQLSGGQQQRVALARALAPSPAVVLLDEPFSNLDPDLRAKMRGEVLNILRRAKTTAVLVTHDQEEAFSMADRVAVMNSGRIEQIGTPEEVYHFPSTRFVADFVGQADFIKGIVEKHGIVTELGVFPNNTPFATGTRVQLMIRPDDITFTPDERGNGVVEDREFKGSENLYSLRLASGKLVHSSCASTLLVERGTRVRVNAAPVHIVVFTEDR